MGVEQRSSPNCKVRCPYIQDCDKNIYELTERGRHLQELLAKKEAELMRQQAISGEVVLAEEDVAMCKDEIRHNDVLSRSYKLDKEDACKNCPGLKEFSIGNVTLRLCQSPFVKGPFMKKLSISGDRWTR